MNMPRVHSMRSLQLVARRVQWASSTANTERVARGRAPASGSSSFSTRSMISPSSDQTAAVQVAIPVANALLQAGAEITAPSRSRRNGAPQPERMMSSQARAISVQAGSVQLPYPETVVTTPASPPKTVSLGVLEAAGSPLPPLAQADMTKPNTAAHSPREKSVAIVNQLFIGWSIPPRGATP
jgi:hypothetical protein